MLQHFFLSYLLLNFLLSGHSFCWACKRPDGSLFWSLWKACWIAVLGSRVEVGNAFCGCVSFFYTATGGVVGWGLT